MENNDREVKIPLSILKNIFKDIFWSNNYFKIEIPKEYYMSGDNKPSKYDKTIAWYESNWEMSNSLWQILTVIDASIDDENKKGHIKSLIRQLFYSKLRKLNDEVFDRVDIQLCLLNKQDK